MPRIRYHVTLLRFGCEFLLLSVTRMAGRGLELNHNIPQDGQHPLTLALNDGELVWDICPIHFRSPFLCHGVTAVLSVHGTLLLTDTNDRRDV